MTVDIAATAELVQSNQFAAALAALALGTAALSLTAAALAGRWASKKFRRKIENPPQR